MFSFRFCVDNVLIIVKLRLDIDDKYMYKFRMQPPVKVAATNMAAT
jgi:hypothetical protein